MAHAAGIVILKQTSRHTQNGSTVVARRPNCDEGLRPTLLARTAVGLAVNNLEVTISRYHGQSPSLAIQYPGLLSHYPFDALKKNWMEKVSRVRLISTMLGCRLWSPTFRLTLCSETPSNRDVSS